MPLCPPQKVRGGAVTTPAVMSVCPATGQGNLELTGAKPMVGVSPMEMELVLVRSVGPLPVRPTSP